MPSENAIVAPITTITPPVTKKGVDMLREAPEEGFLIEFEGNQSARLLPDERAAVILQVLETLRGLHAPVYVDIRPDTRVIVQVLIPLVGIISGIQEGSEEIEVVIEVSAARHYLKRTNPEFEGITKIIRTAFESKALIIITENDKKEIIDARIYPENFTRPPVSQTQPLPVKPKKRWFSFWWPLCCICAVSAKRSITLFNELNGKSCNPLDIMAPCIPFLYPDDGCWGRAHEMYRLLNVDHVYSRKVWIYGNLHVNTRNNPACAVNWGWHVAPIICVKGTGWLGWLFRKVKVVDPSLFTEPVVKSTWKSVQGDANARLVETSGSIFYHTESGYSTTDDTYTQTNAVLATYRSQLALRVSAYGPPPYAACP